MSGPEAFPIAVKNSPRSNHTFVTYLYKLVECLTGNASYASPTPSVATLKAAGDGLATANAKAKNGGQIAVSDRGSKRVDADKLVDQLVAYVRVTVRAQEGDPASAAAMILSSGLSVRKHTKPQKAALAARYGAVSSEIVLVALAVARTGVYFWEYSLDQVTWTSVPQTLKARVTIKGLTPAKVYYFRFRAQTRKGMGDYSPIASILAH